MSGCILLLLSAMSPKDANTAVTLVKVIKGLKPVTTICVGGPGPHDVLGSYLYGLRL